MYIYRNSVGNNSVQPDKSLSKTLYEVYFIDNASSGHHSRLIDLNILQILASRGSYVLFKILNSVNMYVYRNSDGNS